MSNPVEVYAIVEGKTEQIFIERILAPYLSPRGIYLRATQLSKPGQKGGDVRFDRVKHDVRNFLRQRADTYVSTFVDYYGLHDWPALDRLDAGAAPYDVADKLGAAAKQAIEIAFPETSAGRRFIPFVAVHEFEALLFSDSAILAAELGIKSGEIDSVLKACGGPEWIDNGPQTAPSKRLEQWCKPGPFGKTTDGIRIAEKIGIEKMRRQCPLFDGWLKRLEELRPGNRQGKDI